jgi:predicted nucleic acid-binding protein
VGCGGAGFGPPFLAFWGDAFPVVDTSPAVLLAALDLTINHQFGVWDAIILASAAEARARLLAR